jgi:tRNA A-37 threonylcarbamoyl transferase component Bud32
MPDRAKIRTLYAKLHAGGMTHGDLEPGHVRRRLQDTSQLVLIDFDQAQIDDPTSIKEENAALQWWLSLYPPQVEDDA